MVHSDRRLWLCCLLVWGTAVSLGFYASRTGPRPSRRQTAPLARPRGGHAVRRPDGAAAVSRSRPVKRSKPKPSPAVVYRKTVAAGVPLHVIQVDPRRPEVRFAVATSRYGLGSRDNWSAMIDRTRPVAAITGTYFCTQTGVPVGCIVAGGQTVHRGLMRTAFAFTPGSGGQFVTPGRTPHGALRGFEMMLGGGPRLLTRGQLSLWPHAEGFRDPAVLAAKKRTAVATTRHGKLLLVAVAKPVQLRTLARALQALGAVDAMCLDGGASTGLYIRGKTRVKPGRLLTNLLVVYDSSQRYQQQLSSLIPNGLRVVEAPAGEAQG